MRTAFLIALNTFVLIVLLEAFLRFVVGVEPLDSGALDAIAASGTVPEKLELVDPPAFMTDGNGLLVGGAAFPGTNSEGYRTPEFDAEANRRNTILFLGDSFTWGHSAHPIEHCFADLVRAAGYNVVNLGIPSTGPAQYAAAAERYLPRTNPDAVCVMVFAGNDLVFEPEILPGFQRWYYTSAGLISSYDTAGTQISFEVAAAQYESLLRNHGRPPLVRILNSTAIVTLGRMFTMPSHQQNTEELIQSRIRRVHRACVAQGAKMLVFVLSAPSADAGYQSDADSAARILAEFDPVSPTYFGDDHYSDTTYDHHFNNQGHARMSEVILERLHREGIEPTTAFGVSGPAAHASKPSTLEGLATYLSLSPKQTAEFKSILDAQKDDLAQLYLQRPEGGGYTPGKVLNDAVLNGKPLETARRELDVYLSTHRAEGAGISYAEELLSLRAAFRVSLATSLEAEQAALLETMRTEALEAVFTGHVAFGDSQLTASNVVTAGALGIRLDRQGRAGWADFARALNLSPQQSEAIQGEYELLHTETVQIMQMASADGGPSPLEILALSAAEWLSGENGKATPIDAYMAKSLVAGINSSYTSLIMERQKRCNEKIDSLLDPVQQKTFGRLLVANIRDVDTGTDALGKAVSQRLDQLRESVAAQGQARGPNAWSVFKASLDLDPAQSESAKAILNTLKDNSLAVLCRKSADNGLSPVAYFRERIREGDPKAMERFLEYMRAQLDSATGKPYPEVLSGLDIDAREAISALLNTAQRRRLQGIGAAMSEIHTGYDPMGDALR